MQQRYCLINRASGCLAFLVGLIPTVAFGLPTDWQVQQGDVHFHMDGTTLNVTSNSQHAVVNYGSFNIAHGETVNFNFLLTGGSILNQVIGPGMTNIAGSLNGLGGNVFLTNAAGINFASTAHVNVGSLIASTMPVSAMDAAAGRWTFEKSGIVGQIQNAGSIVAQNNIVLMGGVITNTGTMQAPTGAVHLAVGDKITLAMGVNQSVEIKIDQALLESITEAQQAIANSGDIQAHTIDIETKLVQSIYNQVVNNTGMIQATNVSTEGGKIRLQATSNDQNALVLNTGTLDVSNSHGNGGQIHLIGDKVTLTGGALLNASGQSAGGDIDIFSNTELIVNSTAAISALGDIGGRINFHAGNYLVSGTTLDVQGVSQGGQVSLTSDGSMDLMQHINASASHGHGGQVHVDALSTLTANSGHTVDVSGLQAGNISVVASHTITSGSYFANAFDGVGGHIDFGGDISMLSAHVHADGSLGGGRIRIGGEYQGGKQLAQGCLDEVKNSDTTLISYGTNITAKATGTTGNGGEVIVWSDDTTHFYGSIDTRPGTQVGQGGFVELSGSKLNMTEGSIFTGYLGRHGTILLDPKDLFIQDTIMTAASFIKLVGPGNNEFFGTGLALNHDGSIMAVGAGGANGNRGSVYLYNVDTQNLNQAPSLGFKIANGTVAGLSLSGGDIFGKTVAINSSGSILAVGAYGDDTGGGNAGAAYVFSLNTADLSQTPTLGFTLQDDGAIAGLDLQGGDLFGDGIALNGLGNILAVGATGDDINGSNNGGVYLFSIDPNNLTTAPVLQTIVGSDLVTGYTLANDTYSGPVVLNDSGNIMAIGAGLDDTSGLDRGAVYLFNLDPNNLGSSPILRQKIADNGSISGFSLGDGDIFGNLGMAMSGAGDILAVAATNNDTGGSNRGAAFLFNLNEADLTQTAVLTKKIAHGEGNLSLTNGSNFGWGIGLSRDGKILAASTPWDAGRGAVYLLNIGNHSYLGGSAFSNQISSNILKTLLNTGNNLTLQANNDIFINSDLIVNNPWGDGGDLTLAAGRSIFLNANIFTDNGDLTFIANDLLANGVVDAQRDSGAASIIMGMGTTINAGSGQVIFDLRSGMGKTNSDAGMISINEIIANRFNLSSYNSIFDGNGAANNLTASANSFLTAVNAVIGTSLDPIEVNITGGTLTVKAGGVNGDNHAVDINGVVNPSNKLVRDGIFSGQVCFNGNCWTQPVVNNTVIQTKVERAIINNNQTEARNVPQREKSVFKESPSTPLNSPLKQVLSQHVEFQLPNKQPLLTQPLPNSALVVTTENGILKIKARAELEPLPEIVL